MIPYWMEKKRKEIKIQNIKRKKYCKNLARKADELARETGKKDKGKYMI